MQQGSPSRRSTKNTYTQKRNFQDGPDDYSEYRQQKRIKNYMRTRVERYRSDYDWEDGLTY